MPVGSSFDYFDSDEDSYVDDATTVFFIPLFALGFAVLFGVGYLILADIAYIFIEYGFVLGVLINLGIAVAILLISSIIYFITKRICRWRYKAAKAKIKTASAIGFEVMPSLVDASVKIIGFKNKKTVRNLFVPSTLDNKFVREIAPNAFSESPLLTSVEIEDGVEVVGLGAFQRCDELLSATLPGSVAQIDSSAFSGCKKLRRVALSEGLIKIDAGAFFKCPALQSVAIPRSVCHIGRVAFDKTTTLLVYPNSCAETWARENRYRCQRIA